MSDPLIPHPSALIESMRSMGYRTHTAFADLVDNSISANAHNVHIEMCPAEGQKMGWVRIEDDGEGMDVSALRNAMRWGGDGPRVKRNRKDLGRFGLGLKTASFSMGRRLTLISRKGGKTNAFRWDLDTIYDSGKWNLLKGVDTQDEKYLEGSIFESSNGKDNGTIVLITCVDKLRIDGHSLKGEQANRTTIIRTVQSHLGLVFHRFIEKKSLKINFGAVEIKGWNLFGIDGNGEEVTWLKSTEQFCRGTIRVRTFVLPHYKTITEAQHEKLGGPAGWGAHQGFFVYRADRLIVAGGWLGFFRPEEHCKLARVTIDLPNNVDEEWGLDVIKSKISPPTILKADLERVAAAARRNAMSAYRFHGERVAPSVDNASENASSHAFWKQVVRKHDVSFSINRKHPLVEALIQQVGKKEFADAFIYAFEHLLPIAAILQEPSKTTNGLAIEPDTAGIERLVTALKLSIKVLVKSGCGISEATEIAISSHPFSQFKDLLRAEIQS